MVLSIISSFSLSLSLSLDKSGLINADLEFNGDDAKLDFVLLECVGSSTD